MAKNTSISLGDHFEGFIHELIASGRFGTASEVVRAALRLLEEHEMEVAALRQIMSAGDERGGKARPIDRNEGLRATGRNGGVEV